MERRLSTRRDWLTNRCREALGVGALGSLWSATASDAHAQSGTKICPWGLAGTGPGMWYYYCRQCTNGYPGYPAGGMASPTPISNLGCGCGSCVPILGGGLPAPSKCLPSPQWPNPTGVGAGTGPTSATITFYTDQNWGKYAPNTSFSHGIKVSATNPIPPAFDPALTCNTADGCNIVAIGHVTGIEPSTSREFSAQLMLATKWFSPYSGIQWLIGHEIALDKTYPSATFTKGYNRVCYLDFNYGSRILPYHVLMRA